jgi:hypothetical protein
MTLLDIPIDIQKQIRLVDRDILREYNMPRREPVRQRTAIKGKLKIVDMRLSVCQGCRRGVFEGTEYVWTNTGYRHKKPECLNEVKLAS